MDRNVKIAKELVRLAKSLISSSSDEFAIKKYEFHARFMQSSGVVNEFSLSASGPWGDTTGVDEYLNSVEDEILTEAKRIIPEECIEIKNHVITLSYSPKSCGYDNNKMTEMKDKFIECRENVEKVLNERGFKKV